MHLGPALGSADPQPCQQGLKTHLGEAGGGNGDELSFQEILQVLIHICNLSFHGRLEHFGEHACSDGQCLAYHVNESHRNVGAHEVHRRAIVGLGSERRQC